MYKFYILPLFLIYVLVTADPVTFQDCGSEYYLYEVDIEDCSSLPCALTIGGQHRINMGIFANSDSEQLRQEVFLILRSVYRKVDVTPDDPCNQLTCPISNNFGVSFSAIMTINETLVPLDGELYWRLYNQDETMVVCMRTDVELQYG
ncbi:ML domain [Popillia japonica]|uniref:ML domain n=1 Tax=Popillia japonica TaxID=7064 RepID=A0AAW1JCD9_POPJA